MASEAFGLDNRWWRWSEYVIKSGYLRPAPGARLETYSVWDLYAKAKRLNDEPPYFSLIRLVEEMPYSSLEIGWFLAKGTLLPRAGKGSGVVESLSPEDQQKKGEAMTAFGLKIKAWYARFGAMGLLLTKTLGVVLPKSREPFPELGPRSLSGQKRHRRTATGWDTRFQVVARTRSPCAIIKTPEGWHEEKLSKTWASYFPDVPLKERDKFHYPLPLSDDFWKLYGEQVVQFLSAAVSFRNMVDSLSKVNEDKLDAWYASKKLHDFVENVRPVLHYGTDQTWSQSWIAPSLISAFSMMVLLDQLEGRRVLQCPVCRRPFWTTNPRTKLCGDVHCRWKSQKRRQRGQPEYVGRPRGRPRKEG